MKTELPGSNEASLNALLSQWKLDSALPPRFAERVRKRIERDAPNSTAPLALLWNWLTHAALRPAFAVGYTTILLLAGLTVGYWQAHVKAERAAESLGVRYVQMVDPYQRIHH